MSRYLGCNHVSAYLCRNFIFDWGEARLEEASLARPGPARPLGPTKVNPLRRRCRFPAVMQRAAKVPRRRCLQPRTAQMRPPAQTRQRPLHSSRPIAMQLAGRRDYPEVYTHAVESIFLRAMRCLRTPLPIVTLTHRHTHTYFITSSALTHSLLLVRFDSASQSVIPIRSAMTYAGPPGRLTWQSTACRWCDPSSARSGWRLRQVYRNQRMSTASVRWAVHATARMGGPSTRRPLNWGLVSVSPLYSDSSTP